MIDLDKAYQMMLAQVQKNGADYVYKPPESYGACVYFETDKNAALVPSCIVGHMLSDLGFSSPSDLNLRLDVESHGYASDFNASGANTILRRMKNFGFVDIDEEAIAFLTTVQDHQDNGMPWGRAVEEAHQSALDRRKESNE